MTALAAILVGLVIGLAVGDTLGFDRGVRVGRRARAAAGDPALQSIARATPAATKHPITWGGPERRA